MGIFDRFRSRPPMAPPATSAPATPAHATIETFVTADGVGSAVLADGTTLRFGRSACKGFEPVVGARVVVEDTKQQLGAWRATAMTLDDARYADLLAARDRALGVPPKTDEVALATAQGLAVVVIILEEALPPDAELRAWAAARSGNGVVFSVDRGLEVAVDRRPVLVYPGRTPYPVDERRAGRSFIGLGNGLPGSWLLHRKRGISVPDFWGPTGMARDMTRVIQQLAPHANGVVLPRALDTYVEIEDFMLDSDAPFFAWLRITPASGNQITLGMDAFGFPNVKADSERAVRVAVVRMFARNALLADGETLDVDGIEYRARAEDDWIHLTR